MSDSSFYQCAYCRTFYKDKPEVCPECNKKVFKKIKRKNR